MTRDRLNGKAQRQVRFRQGEKARSSDEANQQTTLIAVKRYLDFKYGDTRIDIVLPDGSAVKLVAGTDGRAYFQIPVND
jgi:hypothetical protein